MHYVLIVACGLSDLILVQIVRVYPSNAYSKLDPTNYSRIQILIPILQSHLDALWLASMRCLPTFL